MPQLDVSTTTQSPDLDARSLAERADPHRCYELAVQSPESEVDFIDYTYRRLRGRSARLLREDFCGTASICCEWVARSESNRAIGVDSDRSVLDWGRRNNVGSLPGGAGERVELVAADVLEVETGPLDVIAAMNFSYWLLKTRPRVKRYFERVRAALRDDGIFFLDAYGGYDSYRVITEERSIADGVAGFTYIWEQEKYDPITGQLVCHMHFAFPDGSRLNRAFSYDWRLWTLPEIRELLEEVGFRRVTCYWQGWDADGNPDGVFEPVEEGEPDAAWIAYLTAEK